MYVMYVYIKFIQTDVFTITDCLRTIILTEGHTHVHIVVE